MLLFIIAFLAGVLTVLAPCVLPLLPVIVGGSVSGGVNRRRAYTVAFSLGVSVILFTLILKASTAFIGIPQYAWMWFSGSVLVIFGIITLFPQIWDRIGLVSTLNRESNKVVGTGFLKQTFWGDVLVGAALGPVFSTCSPTYFVILATVLPASYAVGILDLLAYTFGLVLMLLFVSLIGQKVVDKLGIATDPRGWFPKIIGALFIIVGVLVFSGAEAPLEAWLIEHVYDVTKIEQSLLELRGNTSPLQCADGVCNGTPSSTALTATNTNVGVNDMQKAVRYPKAPEITKAAGYVNTGGKPITISQFKGDKVVLIDFWTYSCINCQRTLPYLRAWYDKYHDQGLEIIGIHTPEFAFERVQANVEKAVNDFGLKYPSVLDNDYGTWNAFGNSYWPRKYLIDIDGYIVYDHAGEGNYDETEKAIQAALLERAKRLGGGMPVSGIAAPTDVVTVNSNLLGSPETYFGASRNEYFGNGTPNTPGTKSFTLPETTNLNTYYLGGTWDIEAEYAQSEGDATLEYQYRAKNVYLVAGSSDGAALDVEVTRDGKPLDKSIAGKDISFKDGKSYVQIGGNRLYHIIGEMEYGNHVLKFNMPKGIQAYTFTFG